MKIREIHKALEDAEDKVSFTFGDGIHFDGWVVEVKGLSLLVMWTPSPFYAQATGTDEMAPPNEWIDFMDIDINSLQWIFNSKENQTAKPKKNGGNFGRFTH